MLTFPPFPNSTFQSIESFRRTEEFPKYEAFVKAMKATERVWMAKHAQIIDELFNPLKSFVDNNILTPALKKDLKGLIATNTPIKAATSDEIEKASRIFEILREVEKEKSLEACCSLLKIAFKTK